MFSRVKRGVSERIVLDDLLLHWRHSKETRDYLFKLAAAFAITAGLGLCAKVLGAAPPKAAASRQPKWYLDGIQQLEE